MRSPLFELSARQGQCQHRSPFRLGPASLGAASPNIRTVFSQIGSPHPRCNSLSGLQPCGTTRPEARDGRGQCTALPRPLVGGHSSGVWPSGRARRRPEAKAGAVNAAEPGGGSGSAAAGDLPRVPGLSRSLLQRIVSSTVLGLLGAVAIVSGGWPFCFAACAVAYQTSQEFFGFVTSKGISQGMKPPPPLLCALISLSCMSFIVWMHVTNGKATAMLAVTSLVVLSLQLVMVETPRFSQLTSSVFGLFYCGYLPSFWVKLRLLAAPAVNSQLLHNWPSMLGGLSHCTVGLVATLTAVLCIIAADTGAFFFGKTFGRTQLIPISPKKTVEGAIGGLLCSNAVAFGVWRALSWPAGPQHAVVLATLVFLSSLFGDLIESVMKREAGLKDAGDLIPGHGGLLDRFDSYLFTGGVVFFYVRTLLPLWGV